MKPDLETRVQECETKLQVLEMVLFISVVALGVMLAVSFSWIHDAIRFMLEIHPPEGMR